MQGLRDRRITFCCVLGFENASVLPVRLGDVGFVPRLRVAASEKRENNCGDHAQSGCYHENVSPLRHRLLHSEKHMSSLANNVFCTSCCEILSTHVFLNDHADHEGNHEPAAHANYADQTE